MKRFYLEIDMLWEYAGFRGTVFSGVQFKDHEDQIVTTNKEHFFKADQYYIIQTKQSWDDSVAACAANGDHIGSLRNAADTKKVNALVSRDCLRCKMWIGLNSVATKGETWQWEDGTESNDDGTFSNYDNWRWGQPNHPDRDFCTTIGHYDDGSQWCDDGCSGQYMILCERDRNKWDEFTSVSNQRSDVIGIETEMTEEWIFVGGPIKGSYIIKKAADTSYDYISNFGMRVEDPCQVIDNKLNINLKFSNTTIKDLKYHSGTDSQFWLQKVCYNDKGLKLMESSSYPFLELVNGNLAILSTPPDQCIRLEVKHMAPDNSIISNVFYLHMVGKFKATVETCSSTHGSCQPNIRDLALTSMAGQSKTVTLFE